jgi:hypothetical protein
MTDNVVTLPVIRIERMSDDDGEDARECAIIDLTGAAERLVMILRFRSERNYATAIEMVERAIAEFRKVDAAHGTSPAHG